MPNGKDNEMKKRVLSLFLAITLCMTLVPTSAWADNPASIDGNTVSIESSESMETEPAENNENSATENSDAALSDEEESPVDTDEDTASIEGDESTEAEPPEAAEDSEDTVIESDNAVLPAEKEEPVDTDENTVPVESGESTEEAPSAPTEDSESMAAESNIAVTLAGEEQNAPVVQDENTVYVARVGDKEYTSLQEILDEELENVEITLLGNVSDDEIRVGGTTTIDMAGYKITGNIDASANLTLVNGTVNGTVTVEADDVTFTMTAPAEAEAAIDGGLEVEHGSCSVTGAKVGVKGKLYFTGSNMFITGTESAVKLTAEPKANLTLYGSTWVDGVAQMEVSAYVENGVYFYYAGSSPKPAKKLTNQQESASAVVNDGTYYASLPAALEAAQDGDTVKLLADYTTGEDVSTIAIVKNRIILDLNGKQIDSLMVGQTKDLNTGEELTTPIAGNLTIKDSGSGSIGKVLSLQVEKGTLTIEGGEIGTVADTNSFVCSDENGEVNITGGEVWFFGCEGGTTNITGGKVYQLSVNPTGDTAPVVNISGGTNHGGLGDGGENDTSIWRVNGGMLNITGGTFGKVGFNYTGGTVAISGGTFQSVSNSGASASAPVMPLLANGCAFFTDNLVQDGTKTSLENVTVKEHTHTPDENGKCVCGASIIASVKAADGTERTYSSFTDALAAAAQNEGSTLQLLYDVDLGYARDGVSVDSGKFTLDLNSKTFSGEIEKQLLTVSGTADITIKNGKLVNTYSKDSSVMNRGLANAIQIAGGTTALENVEVTSGCGENGAHTDAVCLSAGSLTVASGIFTGAILVKPKTADQHPVLKITSATLHNGIGYFIWNTSTPDYEGVKALFADGSLLFDKDGNYIDITNAAYWQTDSSEGESVAVFMYSKECSVKPHTHTIVNGKCSVCGEVEGDGCIAHATIEHYTWHFKTLQELADQICGVGWIYQSYPSVTVTFLTDVTVTEPVKISQCSTHINLDLDGHTISGALDTNPMIEVSFVYGVGGVIDGVLVPHCIAIQNGTIENTGTGAALQLSNGATTLENVNVKGDMTLAYQFASSGNYIPTFLGGGSFTKICTVNGASGWQKKLEDMLPKGYYFADITSGKRVSQTALNADNPLENVTVKPCNHKDTDGKSTFTYKPQRDKYYYCSICGNLCPHEHRTETADGRLHCEDCGLTLTTVRRDSRNTITYYIDMNDAFGTAYEPVIRILCNQTCTQAALTYHGSNTIDLNGFTVTANNSSGMLFAPYVSGYQMTLQNSAENQGNYVCEYLEVYNGGTLAIPAENNNLTISAVLIKSDGNAKLAGGSFGKISVEDKKTLAGLLVSGYYFVDTASGEPAAMYDADGNALTDLTNVTVKPCSHDTAVCGPDGVWKCLCGQKVFAASITKDDATTYYTDLQEAFSAADGNTVKLLANVDDVTVSTGKPFTFDLNGCEVYSLTVKNKITIKDSSGGKGKIAENLIVEVDGLTVGDLLEEGYAFRSCLDKSWPLATVRTVANVSVQPMPIRSVTAMNPTVTAVYGQTSGVTLTATVVPFAEGRKYTCQWYKLGGTASPIDGATDRTYQLPADLAADTYTYRLTATEDGYQKSCDFTVTVTPVSIEGATVNVQTLTYNGNAQNPTAMVTLGEIGLTKDKDYTVTATPQTNVGSYTLTVTGRGNYTGEIENVDWKIEPMQLLRYCGIGSVTKTYDGTAAAPIAKSALTFRTKGAVVTLPEDAYDITNARFTMQQSDGTCVDSPEAGDGKSLFFTVTLKSANYVFQGDKADVMDCDYTTDNASMFTITQDTIDLSSTQFTQYVFNDLAKAYEIELKPLLDKILLQQQQHIGREYGNIVYTLSAINMKTEYYSVGGAKIENSKLSLPINAANSTKDEIGTVAVAVETTNYQPFTLTIHIIAQDKLVPVPAKGHTVSAADITYGQTLADSTLTVNGKMVCPRTGNEIKGTFAWTDSTIKPAAGDYTAEWTFTPAEGYEEYTTATGTVTVKVAPKSIEGATITLNQTAFQYDTTEKAPTIAEVKLADWTDEITYDIVSGDKATNASDRITLTIQGKGNYTGTAAAEWKIIPKVVTNPSIKVASCTYNGQEQQPSVELKDGDVVIPEEEYAVGYSDNINAGTDTATVTITNKPGGNYTVSGSANFTINKAAAPSSSSRPAVTVINNLAKTYEMVLSNDYLPKLSAPCEYGNVSYSLKGTYLTDGYKNTVRAKVMEENGQYKLKLTVPVVDYNMESSVGTIDVRVTADNYQDFTLTIGVKTKNKDVSVPDGTISVSDITYGQALNDSKIAGKMKADGKAIDGTFTWKNGTIKPNAGSYDAEWVFTPAEGYEEYATATGIVAVTVNRKSVTVSGITARNKVYDGKTNATLDCSNAKFNGVLENDTLTVTATGKFEGADVGEQKVKLSSFKLDGNSAANYVPATEGNQTETTATITAKEVTVALAPNGGTYGSVTAAAAVLSGVVDGETVPMTLTYTGNGCNSTSVPTDVGSYTVTASIADSNYILTGETTANFVITPKTVIVSGITAKDKAYDGTTYAELVFGNAKLDGILENDTLTVTAKGEFSNANVGKQKVSISGLTLGGDSVANYVLAESGNQAETTATITAKQITVSITPNGGTYGETITPATVKANDVVGEDTPEITLTYTGTANDGTKYNGTEVPTKAGTYTITATTSDPNYTLDADTSTAEFTVAKRPATVTPDNKSKVYEEKDPELTYKVSGVLDGETLEEIMLARAEGENAGEYAIIGKADADANPNYDVTFAGGKFTINPKSIDGATVKLGAGLTANGKEQTQTVAEVLLDDKPIPADSYTVTDNAATNPGSYTLTITAKGNYTGSIKWTYVIAPAKVEDAPGEDITIGSGKVKVNVKSEGNVPPVGLLTDKAELLAMLVDSGDITADELAQIANGASVDIVLTVKEANVTDEVKTAMAQAAKDYTIGQYLDISLLKYMTVNGKQQDGVALHTTKNALTISVVMPDALINTNSALNRTYCIVRHHDGTIAVLDAVFDAANKTLTFKTDRFSDYAIAYKDTAVPSSSNSDSNNSSNNSETKQNEVTPTPTPTPANTSKPSTMTTMPQTGDTSSPMLYIVLLVVSLLGLAVVFVCKRRNNK